MANFQYSERYKENYFVSVVLFFVMVLCNISVFASDETEVHNESHANNNNAAFDLGAPPKTRIQLTPQLSFGSRIELEYTQEDNFDLENKESDDTGVFSPTISLAFSYIPNEKIMAFFNIEPSFRLVNDEEEKKNDETKFDLKQAFVTWYKVIDGLNLKIGRQRFLDEREWLYDEELDAIRVFYAKGKFAIDFSVIEENDKNLIHDSDDKKITDLVLYGKYELNKDNVCAVYSFVRDDRTEMKEDTIFYGLHLDGEIRNNLEYWMELSHVRGRNGSQRIKGIGFDLGCTYGLDIPLKPSITLGHAFGSGDDDPNDDTDTDYRQTGLQDNNAKFSGITRLKYYGEMFDPELSNLSIFTGGIGIRPMKYMSVDFVYHYYRQAELSENIRDAEIGEDPNGLNRNIGQETDLVVGFRRKPHLKASFVMGYFIPGQAFPKDTDNALFTEIKIQYEF